MEKVETLISLIAHTTEYYSAVKRNKLPIDTIWIKLPGVLLSESSLAQRATHRTISFTGCSGKDKTIGTEQMAVAKRWG